jgi:hypothetical protein
MLQHPWLAIPEADPEVSFLRLGGKKRTFSLTLACML